MTREFLKNIKNENRLDKIRLIMTNDDVIGGQPSDDENFTSNTPFLDIACTMKFAIDAASTADGKADAAKTAAANADKKAAGAQTSANTADSKAVAAQKTADAAKTAAANADKKAAGAQTSANTADSKAVAAQKTAYAAKTAAENADKKAAGAQTSATTADSKAVAAQKTADEAKTAAANADKKVKPIIEGGTGATTVVNARKNLGLGTSATLNKTDAFGTSSNLVATQLLVDKLQKELVKAVEVPVDQVFYFDKSPPPPGYIARTGQTITEKEMPLLFKRYGGKMPDDRDRVHRAEGPLAGNAGAAQEDAMQNIFFGSPQGPNQGWLGNGVVSTGMQNGALKITSSGDPWSGVADSGHNRSNWFFWDVDISRTNRTATETRVKARIIIACNKIQ